MPGPSRTVSCTSGSTSRSAGATRSSSSRTAPINEWLMEQLIIVDALKRASAKRITVVAPFYPYARQDKKGRGREPISARLVADLFKAAGAHRIMSVDLHAAQIQGFFDGPVDHLFAMPVLLEHFREILDPSMLTVVSPDMGRVRVADIWSEKLGAPSPSSTSVATRWSRTRSRSTRSSATSPAAGACSSTT
ncbi:ribose-phosphate diphosphokinase [Sphingomonas sp. LR61]